MVDYIVRHISKTIQRTSGMKHTRQLPLQYESKRGEMTHSSPDIDVLSDTLDSGCLVEVTRYNTFSAMSDLAVNERDDSPDDIPIGTTG